MTPDRLKLKTLNDNPYIERAAKSVLLQTKGKPVEVIFINDGDQASYPLLKPFLDTYPREAIYHGQKNKGVASARNGGMELARGEYLWFVDADDTIADRAVDAVLEQISAYRSDVFVFRMDDFDQQGNAVENTRSFHQGSEPLDCDGVTLILNRLSYSPVQMCVFNRRFMEERKLRFEELAPHDLELMPRLMIQAAEVRLVPMVIYHYYHHYNTKNKSKFTIWRTENHLKMLDQYDVLISTIDDENVRKALYITQFRQLRHILHDPDKGEFEKNYEHWNIKERKLQIRRILKNTFTMVDSLKSLWIWCLWYVSPKLYKKLQFRVKYAKKH